MRMFVLFLILSRIISLPCFGQADSAKNEIYWKAHQNNVIVWDLSHETRLPHGDNIEMSGLNVASIIRYEVDDNKELSVSRDIIFPQLRPFIKSGANEWAKYRAYLREEYPDSFLPTLTVGERTYEPGTIDSIVISGMIKIFHAESSGLTLQRTLVPSMTERLFVEVWTLTNTTDSSLILNIGKTSYYREQTGQNGVFIREIVSDGEGEHQIGPGEMAEFATYFSARRKNEERPDETYSQVLMERYSFLDVAEQNLVLETPDPVLNTLFTFSKIRAAESIYNTNMGVMHSPGGGRYYTGVWANDQCEYASPFFPYLGYRTGNLAALNSYLQFLKNIPEAGGHFWSSFEMDGTLTCCGADRGDAAMIAFGGSHFALVSGDHEVAQKIWPLIEWSLNYCERKKNDEGVVTSDSDEMEGRIATGGANLATSSLYYGALDQSILLAKALNKPKEMIAGYEKQRQEMKDAIEHYFGAEIEGLKTYQYFKGHPYLRHWICLPLVVGIEDRKEGTLEALFTKLWTTNGIKVEHNPNLPEPDLFWDRGTLYAFRGAFKAGAANRGLEKLHAFSQTRLLGFHVPYVVEAWPEGNMAHLSAESALYCRIFTEGILGIVPTGFSSFEMSPNLPDNWDYFKLKRIKAFGSDFDVLIKRKGKKLSVSIVQKGKLILKKTIDNGDKMAVKF